MFHMSGFDFCFLSLLACLVELGSGAAAVVVISS